ncbi:hypothetical protein AP053_gp184 [Ostreococcus mediterraneus virus 1]|uniref:hypothetical protein n=1 Tax=Ostreococcus mediterraneus virus 1 TaxID=1663210 RepID=UPI0006CF687A|nr:hypothetical protein AP053_gp003 [Ostreococcus mediterraneus virus 1]YP_009173010.1 hypothetical protein AP053_gp184 [Ostreococcus mediterraneus virus 1]ALI95114.1 hypothetical protein OmV1_003 [Ostreococcus mediterraneus virus 1]ALI95361.1 hypothetical protein OmV1_250c [Ostreococcus mediterraneus virus 1]
MCHTGLCRKNVIHGNHKYFGKFGEVPKDHKTLPVNLKYTAPKPNTSNIIRRSWTTWEPVEGSSRVRGGI